MALFDIVRQDSVELSEFVAMGFEHERSIADVVTSADVIFAVFDEGRVPFRARLERTDFMTATLRRTELL